MENDERSGSRPGQGFLSRAIAFRSKHSSGFVQCREKKVEVNVSEQWGSRGAAYCRFRKGG